MTGRLKDLIVIQGRNFHCSDIESAATIPGVAAGRVVAFGVTNPATGTEDLIVLAEAEEDAGVAMAGLPLAIRAAVAQAVDCTPNIVRIVPARWIVKSSSGKLARADCRTKYLSLGTGADVH